MFQEAMIYGFGYSVWLSVLILLSYKHEPRIWLHDYPQEMQDLVPPKSDAELRLMKLWSIPITGSMILLPLVIALLRHEVYHFTFFSAYLFIGAIMLVFCLIDLIILDWLITVWWRPAWMHLKGAEEMMHLDNYQHHLVRSCKGLVFPAVGAGVLSLPFIWL
ncbi:MAG: hypothetical protein AAF541_21895 [Pseudomonadota bacterium]